MKKILLTIALLGGIISLSKAQTNYCKDIKTYGAGGMSVSTTPPPVWKNTEPTIQLYFSKITKGTETTLELAVGTNANGLGASVTDVTIEFEDGDKLVYSNLTLTALPKGYGTFGTHFQVSNNDIAKLQSKKVKSLSMMGNTESSISDSYKDKIMGYAACLGGSLAGGTPTTTNTFNGKMIEGFWGVKFGSSQDEVKSAILAKGPTLSSLSTADELMFQDVTFTQRRLAALSFKFVNNKFYEADVTYPAPDDIEVISTFKTIINELSEVYGKPNISKNFQFPYADGDGFEAQGIKQGKVSFTAVWKTSNNNAIQLQIDKNLSLSLFYTDGTLEKTKDSKKSADY